MATQAVSGVGTELRIGDGASSEVFTAVPEMVSFSWTGQDSEELDATHLGNDTESRDYLLGFRNLGEITATFNFREDSWDDWYALWLGRAENNFQFATPGDARVITVAGLVKSHPWEPIGVADVLRYGISIRVTAISEISS